MDGFIKEVIRKFLSCLYSQPGIILVVFTITLYACKQEEVCLQPSTVYCRGGFYRYVSSDTLKDSSLINANIFFQVNDTLFQFNIKNSSLFALPPSITNDSTRFIFQSDSSSIDPVTIDTITLYCKRNPTFVSVACGFQTEFELLQVKHTEHVLDTVLISDAEVSTDVNIRHLKLVLND